MARRDRIDAALAVATAILLVAAGFVRGRAPRRLARRTR